MMVKQYHKQYILQAVLGPKRNVVLPRLRAIPKNRRIVFLAGLVLLAGCDAVQIIENRNDHVSVRYDGLMNGLDAATELAKRACASHGRTAKLQRVYYEGLGAGERFAFFECV
jgi:hypothetical protein